MKKATHWSNWGGPLVMIIVVGAVVLILLAIFHQISTMPKRRADKWREIKQSWEEEEIPRSEYEEVKNWVIDHPRLKPLVKKALEDNKITRKERDEIQKVKDGEAKKILRELVK
jgi:hypothetical protein